MPYADDLLANILDAVQVEPETIAAAVERRTDVLTATSGFDGRLRHYRCGSVEYGTAITPPPNRSNDKGVDGDGGIVLDRTVHTTLGPDAAAKDGPCDVVKQVQDHIRPKLKETYPKVTVGQTTKRAILVRLNAPLENGQDPPVELIVALTRKSGGGLWIPNLADDTWDAADPEKHRRLINEKPKPSLRKRRRHVMRLVKHWNKKHSQPAFSSFHLQALALDAITDADVGASLRTSLQHFFERAAESLEAGDTPDPADVSDDFHLENGISRDIAVARLASAGEAMASANSASDDTDTVLAAYRSIFHGEVVDAASLETERAALSQGNRTAAVAAGGRITVTSRPLVSAATKNPNAWRFAP